jgi:hypothetical protein
MRKGLLTFAVLLLTIGSTFGQFKYGADFYSRYVWRGVDYGNSPAIQPSITYTTGGLSLGFWGSYALTQSAGTTYSENDFCASYTLGLQKSGSITACFTDYYMPYAGIRFGNYKPNEDSHSGAAHTLELGASYTGPEKFPVSLAFYANVSNDPDNSTYIQASYPFTVNETTLTLIAGLTTTKNSAYYGTTDAGFINVGINVAKTIAITDKFSLPVNVSYINNPTLDVSDIVFGVGFTF